MNRRYFAAYAIFGLALPLAAGSSLAQEAKKAPASKPAPAGPNAALSADEIVTRVQAFYDKTTTFKAVSRAYVVKEYARPRLCRLRDLREAGKMSCATQQRNAWFPTGSDQDYEKRKEMSSSASKAVTAACRFDRARQSEKFKFTKQDAKR